MAGYHEIEPAPYVGAPRSIVRHPGMIAPVRRLNGIEPDANQSTGKTNTCVTPDHFHYYFVTQRRADATAPSGG